MADDRAVDAVRIHWERPDLRSAVLEVLVASGRELDRLTPEDLEPLDQFHGGGLGFTRRLAELGGLEAGTRVLDVGGGLGGPARTLAAEFGCLVSVVDLTESYVETGRMLTSLVGLEDRVAFQVGDAVDLPFADATFDAVWTQNSGMNIADKERLYAGFRRVLRPGGRLVIQEPMAGPGGPPIFPTMWAAGPSTDHLRTPDEMRALIEASGFEAILWEQVTPARSGPGGPPAGETVQGLVMGLERLTAISRASQRNELERRIVMVHAVFRADDQG